MKVDVLLGLQWGDEGKGKIIDVLTPRYDIIARFQGGPNAGHTLEFNGQKHVLHLIPSGIFHEGKKNLLGNGMVICPIAFKQEIEMLLPYITIDELKERIVIAKGANLILPIHRLLDGANEKAKGEKKIGTTGKGIGPTYTDRTSRIGLLVRDIFTSDFTKKYDTVIHSHLTQVINEQTRALHEENIAFFEAIEFMKQFQIVDGPYWIDEQLKAGKKILAEGAQGTLLDIDHGNYPFVTSSNTTIGGVCTGLGIAANRIGKVYGLFKAYCTRVGMGPFPTELGGKKSDEWCATKSVTDEKNLYPDANINDPDPFIQGIALRKKGFEFGATTGRLRRTGWLDMPALKYACMINGVTDLVMSKADVLSDFEKVDMCISYDTTPIYTTFDGWKSVHDKNFDLYVSYIEEQTQTPITIISTGPDREQIIIHE